MYNLFLTHSFRFPFSQPKRVSQMDFLTGKFRTKKIPSFNKKIRVISRPIRSHERHCNARYLVVESQQRYCNARISGNERINIFFVVVRYLYAPLIVSYTGHRNRLHPQFVTSLVISRWSYFFQLKRSGALDFLVELHVVQFLRGECTLI